MVDEELKSFIVRSGNRQIELLQSIKTALWVIVGALFVLAWSVT